MEKSGKDPTIMPQKMFWKTFYIDLRLKMVVVVVGFHPVHLVSFDVSQWLTFTRPGSYTLTGDGTHGGHEPSTRGGLDDQKPNTAAELECSALAVWSFRMILGISRAKRL